MKEWLSLVQAYFLFAQNYQGILSDWYCLHMLTVDGVKKYTEKYFLPILF